MACHGVVALCGRFPRCFTCVGSNIIGRGCREKSVHAHARMSPASHTRPHANKTPRGACVVCWHARGPTAVPRNAGRIKHHGCWLLQCRTRAPGTVTRQQQPRHAPNTLSATHGVTILPQTWLSVDVMPCVGIHSVLCAWFTSVLIRCCRVRRPRTHDSVATPRCLHRRQYATHHSWCLHDAYSNILRLPGGTH